MSKKPKMAPYRPEEEAYLKRWKGSKSAPSLWEKIDKDVKFNSQLRGRIEYDEDGYPLNEVTMSNRNSIGKTRGPRK
jgi:hypothetical protein